MSSMSPVASLVESLVNLCTWIAYAAARAWCLLFALLCLALVSRGLLEAQVPVQPAFRFAAPVRVGATATGVSTVQMRAAGSLSAIRVVTQGVAGADFAPAAGGSCNVGMSYAAGQTCTVAVGFTPAYPGARQGAVVLVAGDGSVLGMELLAGTGVGAMGVFVPGIISTVAGNGQWIFRGDGGQATGSSLFLPMGGAADAAGNLFLSDSNNQRIRRVDAASGVISTVAGNGAPGFGGDGGAATAAMLDTPSDVILDGAGDLLIADSANHAVRMVSAATGVISTIAGIGGQQGYAGDGGPATAAHLAYPNGLAFDGDHTLYISDTGNNAVRRVDLTTGIITTLAGTGAAGYTGDGGQAAAGTLNYPWGIGLGGDGSLYIADLSNNCVRKVSAAGVLSTVAGTGARGFGGDGGLAKQALLNVPASVVVDVAGNLYVTDSGNHLVRKVSAVTGKIETIAGVIGGTGGDGGPATSAGLDGPYAVFLDGPGNLYIADMFHHLIRMVSPAKASFAFPVMRVGRVSAPQVETLENDGNAALDFSELQLTSNSALDRGTTTCAVGQAVAVDASCALGVEFAPTVTGASVFGSIALISDAANSPANIALSGQVLSVDPTTMTLTSNLNPAGVGAAVTFTAIVTTSGQTPPTGSIDFMDGTGSAAVKLGTGTMSASGAATFTTASLTPGTHAVTAVYAGDASNAGVVSSVLNESVRQPTTTLLTVDTNPSIASTTVTFSATVSGPAGTTAIPGGTVTFSDGAVALGTSSVSASGVATFSTSGLGAGQHSMTASYGGDSRDLTSVSSVLVQTVAQAVTSTVLGSSAGSLYAGASVTFTIAVSRQDGIVPTGSVLLMDGATPLGTVGLDSTGAAVFATSALTVGSHSITAVYQGDAGDKTSTSAAVLEIVHAIPTATALAASANPVDAGAVLHLTVTIAVSNGVTTGGTFSGTVTFQEGSTVLGTANVSAAGIATLDVASLGVGPHSIVATYTGNANYAGSSSSALAETVNVAQSNVLMASSANPSVAGTAVMFTATVTTSGGLATGTVSFVDGSASPAVTLGSGRLNGQGVATFATSALATGQHAITGSYGGDAKDAAATSVALIQTVALATTSVAITSSSNPAIAGLSVTFSAVVAGNGAQPSGTVTFKDGSAVLGTGSLAGGRTSFATAALGAGSHVITAVYSGDPNDAGSTSPALTELVQAATTSTALVATPNPASQGAAVTLTAAVTGNGTTPTGTVTFADAGVTVGTATLNAAGAASFATTTLAVGRHPLTATYVGDLSNAGSVSPAVAVSVLPTTSSLLTSNRNPASAGATLVLTVVVSGGSAVPTGTVIFRDGGIVVGTGTVNASGVATISIASLGVGSHNVSASYSGDAANAPDVSPVLTETIQQATTQTGLNASAMSLVVGTAETLTASVTGSGGTPAGSVTFLDGAATLGSGVVNAAGVATLGLTGLAPGQHAVSAVYTGDTNDLGSTSQTLTLTVAQATPSVALRANANPSLGGIAVTLTASFAGAAGVPAGSVTWRDGTVILGTTAIASGTATFVASGMTIGLHPITASYSGDTDNAAAISPVWNQTVQLAASSVALASSANPAVFSAGVTLTASVAATGGAASGTVTFSDGVSVLGSSAMNAAGQAVFATSGLTVGQHNIVAAYAGDANHVASQSAVLVQSILQAGGVTLASSANPALAGTSVVLSATVAMPQGVAASGMVTFKEGAATLGMGNVNGSGVASVSLSTLAVGQHAITAVYGGDGNNQSAISNVLVQTMQTAGTSVALVSSGSPSVAGSPLTLTATVAGKGGNVSGAVTFMDGTTVLGAAQVNGAGVAVMQTSGLAPGLHSLVALYEGDANDLTSTSPVLLESVQQTTTVALSSSQNPSLTPDAVTLTAVVSNGGAQRPSGTVTFSDGALILGSASCDLAGMATFTAPAMAAGMHLLAAAYSGDANNLAAGSAVLRQAVQLRPTSVLLTASSTSLTGGQQVTLISVVRWTGPVAPTGSVTFASNGTVLGTGALDPTGVATLTVNLLSSSPMVASTYAGDAIYAASSSAPTSITVAKPTQFTLAFNPVAMSLATKQHSTATLTLTSLNGFTDSFALGCLGLPFAATCTFSSDQVALAANGVQTVQVVVDTGSPLTAGSQASNAYLRSRAIECLLPGFALAALLSGGRRRRLRGWSGLLLVLLLGGVSAGLSGCSGLQINGTPAGTYVFEVSAAGKGTGVTQTMNVTLTVTQ